MPDMLGRIVNRNVRSTHAVAGVAIGHAFTIASGQLALHNQVGYP
jgi:hypothetical protein